MTDLTTDRATERHCGEPEHAATDLDGFERLPADGPPSALGVSGVRLTRLIALAGLTSPQAFEIGAALLAEAAKRPEPDDDRLGGVQIMIDTNGGIVLVPESHGCGEGKSRAVAGLTAGAVAVVLADLAGAARHRTGRPDPPAAQLLAALDSAVGQLSVTGVPSVARTLREAGAGIDHEAVRAELAALVRAILGSPGSAARSEPTGGPPSPVAGVNGGRRSPSGAAQAAARRIGAWLFSAAVLVAVVLLEVAFFRDDIATDVNLLLDAGRSESAPIAAQEPDGLSLVSLAPAAAGTVRGVDLRTLEPCVPGAPCAVRVLVWLVPAPDPQTVTWSFRVVDRCTGATGTTPGGSVTVPPGAEQATAVGTVALPPDAAVAMGAVTDVPVAAAAPPVLVGSCEPARPGS